MQDPKDNSLNRIIEHPATYLAGSVLVVLGIGMGWLDGWYGLILICIAAFGTYRWFNKRKTAS